MRWTVRALTLLAVLAFLPAGQALNVHVSGGDPLLQPDVPMPLQAEISVSCDTLLGPAASAEDGLEPTLQLDYHADDPLLQVTGPTSVTFDRSQCIPGRADVARTVAFNVTGSAQMEAHEAVRVTVQAAWPDGREEAEGASNVRMSYIPGYEIEVLRSYAKEGPQKIIGYEIQITNLANGKSKFSFEHGTQDLQGNLVLPDGLVLDSAGNEHDQKVVVMSYATPFENGNNHVVESLTARITQEYAFDATLVGPTTEFEVTAETEGVYVPGLGALLLPAIALAALLRRRI